LQGFLLQVGISQLLNHEGDEPDAVIDLFYSQSRTGQDGRDIDLLAMHAEAAATGHHDVAVMERIDDLGQALVGAR
jgi:hypothetical protein